MKPYYLIILVCILITHHGSSQSAPKKWSFSVFGQINDTRYDKVTRQNAWGMGGGIKIEYNWRKNLGLFIEGSSFIFGGTKELHVINGEHYRPKDGVESLHTGLQYRLFGPVKMATSFGPSFSLGNTDWGFRQSLLLSGNKKETVHLRFSFDHVFQDNHLINRDFGYFGYALLVKLF